MESPDQAEQPLRRVKRGRPPKVAAVEPTIQPDSDAGHVIDALRYACEGARRTTREYAMRIWNGQSPDLPVSDRVARINAALLAQGYLDNFTAP